MDRFERRAGGQSSSRDLQREDDERRADGFAWELGLYRWLITLFATLALVLAAIGLFGVMSYTVTARLREFAVRLALGSDPAALGRLVLRRERGSGTWLAWLSSSPSTADAARHLPIGGRPDAVIYVSVAAFLLVSGLGLSDACDSRRVRNSRDRAASGVKVVVRFTMTSAHRRKPFGCGFGSTAIGQIALQHLEDVGTRASRLCRHSLPSVWPYR